MWAGKAWFSNAAEYIQLAIYNINNSLNGISLLLEGEDIS